MNHLPTVNQAKEYVTGFMQEHQNKKLIYHTLHHTETVVEITQEAGIHYGLNNNDLLITLVAAWFVDVGYYEDYRQHEVASAGIAENFLRKTGVGDEIIKDVKSCLLATKIPQSPANLPQQIVCDAVLFHVSAEDFGEQHKLMRRELSLLQEIAVDKDEWRKSTIQFMEKHSYFTDYFKKHLAKRKKDNLEKLKKKDATTALPVDPITVLLQSRPAMTQVPDTKEEKKKEDRPERTIETMFRITADKSQRLSDQADTKSHIMISVNSLILTVLLAVLLQKLKDNVKLPLPMIILMIVNLLTIIFAILATRPRIPAGTFTQNELREKKVNLLFFGNFYKMKFEDYQNGMFQVMDDKYFLYSNLLRDIYTQGVRLGEKYKMLKISYSIFMFGLILSILSFVIYAKIR